MFVCLFLWIFKPTYGPFIDVIFAFLQHRVRSAENEGHAIYLQLKDGRNSILRVYTGEYECGALIKELDRKTQNLHVQGRPGTHDLMKYMMEALGYRVSKVRITALVGNTYHARVHMGRTRGKLSSGSKTGDTSVPGNEVDIDARPSDAINLALRFGAPIYVNKEVAAQMAIPQSTAHAGNLGESPSGRMSGANAGGSTRSGIDASASDIVRSCREEILHYADPTIMHKLQLQLAIAEERFEDATILRDAIEKMLASDRALSLVVAIETALEDQRFEEAARLRDEFKKLRLAQEQRISDIVDL